MSVNLTPPREEINNYPFNLSVCLSVSISCRLSVCVCFPVSCISSLQHSNRAKEEINNYSADSRSQRVCMAAAEKTKNQWPSLNCLKVQVVCVGMPRVCLVSCAECNPMLNLINLQIGFSVSSSSSDMHFLVLFMI